MSRVQRSRLGTAALGLCAAVACASLTLLACSSEADNPNWWADEDGGAAGGAGGQPGTGASAGRGAAEGGTAGAAGSEPFVPEDCTGTEVGAMVDLPLGFAIDATEVTRCQYETWLATNPSTSGQIPACSWNESYEPACAWPTPAGWGKHPVVCVDWCDAVAYCAAAGRRLCGKIGGGANEYGSSNDAASSQWYAACSSGGENKYPYGNEEDGKACNGTNMWQGKTVEVASLPQCQSYPGVYDMSGNVWEWEDSCRANAGPADDCRLRGGSFIVFNYDCGAGNASDRANDDSITIGFRCCSQ